MNARTRLRQRLHQPSQASTLPIASGCVSKNEYKRSHKRPLQRRSIRIKIT